MTVNTQRHLPHPSPTGAVPLSSLQEGDWGRVRFIAGGRGLLARTLALGLVPGTPVRLVRAFGGPAIISVRGSRLALGRQMAERIWVEPLADGPFPAVEPAEGHDAPAGYERAVPGRVAARAGDPA